jgi:hypothetical protein
MKRVLPIAAAFVALVFPAGAAAQPKPRLVAAAQGGFRSLGLSAGYYNLSPQVLRVVSPGKPAGRSVRIPEDCANRDVSLPTALLFCEHSPTYRLFNVNTGAVAAIDTSSCGDPTRLTLGRIGKLWFGGTFVTGYDSNSDPIEAPAFLNRRTGACRKYPRWRGARDLDGADLPQLHSDSCRDPGRRRVFTFRRGRLDVVFCHSRRAAIHLCRKNCSASAAMGRQTVAWLSSTSIHALVIKSGRRYSWRWSSLVARPLGALSLGFVRDRLYVSMYLANPADGEPPVRIFSAPLDPKRKYRFPRRLSHKPLRGAPSEK